MVMERAEESLRGVLQAGGYVSAAKGISFDDTRRAIVTFGLACGVAWLHSGEAAKREVVIHGDIRPRHVLLDGNLYPKLCDFGLASVYHEDSVKPTNAGMGAYLPPEICGGDAKNGYTPARDVWGLGWTIVQVYGAGAPVAQGTAPSLEALRLLPPRLLPIVEKCFAPDPSDRITSFAVAEACYDGTVWDDIDQEEFSTYHAMAVKFVPGLDYDPHK
jgi:serine/threonine protein kinase